MKNGDEEERTICWIRRFDWKNGEYDAFLFVEEMLINYSCRFRDFALECLDCCRTSKKRCRTCPSTILIAFSATATKERRRSKSAPPSQPYLRSVPWLEGNSAILRHWRFGEIEDVRPICES